MPSRYKNGSGNVDPTEYVGCWLARYVLPSGFAPAPRRCSGQSGGRFAPGWDAGLKARLNRGSNSKGVVGGGMAWGGEADFSAALVTMRLCACFG